MGQDLLLSLKDLNTGQKIVQLVDILVVAYIVYRLLLLVRGTRAWRILFGIVVFVLGLWASEALRLNTLHWILDKATLLGPVALAILFLPELRQAIEGLTKFRFFPQQLVTGTSDVDLDQREIEEIVAAVGELAAENVGALIVMEKDARLEEVIASGTPLGAVVTKTLLLSIFYGENPLHDGAAVIRGERVLAAACRLPLSESSRLDTTLHMRHRAAVGITEATDALSIVVSEERGTVSVAQEGKLRRMSGLAELRGLLRAELTKADDEGERSSPWRRRDRSEKLAEKPDPLSTQNSPEADRPEEANV
ncbi:TIGR00159 family protein [bacterium]|nr:MAG: TIGR00159 family protein [bacterium]